MQIIGFNLEKISAERKSNLENKLKINSNLEILEIKTEKIDIVKEKNVSKFSFKFTISYQPDFASISFQGFLLMLLGKDQQKRLLKSWKKKEIPNEVRLPLFNTILTKCNLRALQLEEELNLPTHIPMPKLAPQQNPENQEKQSTQSSQERGYVR